MISLKSDPVRGVNMGQPFFEPYFFEVSGCSSKRRIFLEAQVTCYTKEWV